MITKEYYTERKCLFCASEYHLEMILLPYIKERLDNSKFIIFTQTDLNYTINTLLEKIYLKETDKEKIKSINWKMDDKLKFIQLDVYKNNQENIEAIIYGNSKYIERINNELKKGTNIKLNIIDCFNIEKEKLSIKEISEKYKEILNVRKI